jgi:hypothetical protein
MAEPPLAEPGAGAGRLGTWSPAGYPQPGQKRLLEGERRRTARLQGLALRAAIDAE